jgi:hypothetical protein
MLCECFVDTMSIFWMLRAPQLGNSLLPELVQLRFHPEAFFVANVSSRVLYMFVVLIPSL